MEPFCPNYPACGGCDLQEFNQAMQLSQKLNRLQTLLDPKLIQPILHAPEPVPLFFRNKIRFSFVKVGDQVWPARHARGEKAADIAVQECFLLDPRANPLLLFLADWFTKQQWGIYNPQTGSGYLKHVLIRQGKRTDQWLLGIVTTEPDLPQSTALIEALTSRFPFLTSIYHCKSVGKSMEQLELIPLFGSQKIIEQIGPYQYLISPEAFFQTNGSLLPVLYNQIKSQAGQGKVLWDLYAGSASIGIYLSTQFEKVVSIESNPNNTADAKENLSLNHITNLGLIEGRVEDVLTSQFINAQPSPDVIILDPPRAGLSPQLLRLLPHIAGPRLIYVSCNPTTFASDAEELRRKGFDCQTITPVDMFPHSWHLELVSTWSYPRST